VQVKKTQDLRKWYLLHTALVELHVPYEDDYYSRNLTVNLFYTNRCVLWTDPQRQLPWSVLAGFKLCRC